MGPELLGRAVARMRSTMAVLALIMLILGTSMPAIVRLAETYGQKNVMILLDRSRPNIVLDFSATIRRPPPGHAQRCLDLPTSGLNATLSRVEGFSARLMEPGMEALKQTGLYEPCGRAIVIPRGLLIAWSPGWIKVPKSLANASTQAQLEASAHVIMSVARSGAEMLGIGDLVNMSSVLGVPVRGANETRIYVIVLLNVPLVVYHSGTRPECLGLREPPPARPAPGDGAVAIAAPTWLSRLIGSSRLSTLKLNASPVEVNPFSGVASAVGKIWSQLAVKTIPMPPSPVSGPVGGLPERGGVEVPVAYIPFSEIPDIESALSHPQDSPRLLALVEAALLGSSLNASSPLAGDLARLQDKPIVLPGEDLAVINNGSLMRELRENLTAEGISLPPITASVHIFYMANYVSQVFAGLPLREQTRLMGEAARALAGRVTEAADKTGCVALSQMSYSAESAGTRVWIALSAPPGEGGRTVHVAAIRTVYDSGSSAVYLEREASRSPIAIAGVVAMVPVILLLGASMTSEALDIIIGIMRRWVAVASARGARPSMAVTPLIMLTLAGGLAAGAAGLALAGGLLGAAYTGSGLAEGVKAAVRDPAAVIAAIALVPTVLVLVGYKRASRLAEASPLEAVRPVESVARAIPPRVGRAGLLLLVLGITSLALGLLRPDIERLVEEGGAVAALAMVSVMLGFMFFPFAPAALLSETSKPLAASIRAALAVEGLVRRAARDPLERLAGESGARIRGMLLSFIRTAMMGYAVAVGGALAAGGAGPLREWLASEKSGSGALASLASLEALRGIVWATSLFAGLVTLVLVYSGVAAVFSVMRRQVAILRVRGASRRQALGYVYTSFLPSLLLVLLGGLALGAVYFLSIDAITGFVFIDNWGSGVPHLKPALGAAAWALIGGTTLGIFLVPALVSWRVAATRDLARVLREVA